FRKVVLEKFDMSLGAGLSKVAGKIFRIGHLGAFNDLMLAGTLSGIEMGLAVAGVPHKKGGVQAALDYLAGAGTAAVQKSAAQSRNRRQLLFPAIKAPPQDCFRYRILPSPPSAAHLACGEIGADDAAANERSPFHHGACKAASRTCPRG